MSNLYRPTIKQREQAGWTWLHDHDLYGCPLELVAAGHCNTPGVPCLCYSSLRDRASKWRTPEGVEFVQWAPIFSSQEFRVLADLQTAFRAHGVKVWVDARFELGEQHGLHSDYAVVFCRNEDARTLLGDWDWPERSDD